ncbi:hypothetical protein [Janibacter sp. GXQ6167]|uniref:hypothetical protein n=1 Tax=Janibacter sp. GXQ6167 TaxID=3240791 RepID=UPI003523990A
MWGFWDGPQDRPGGDDSLQALYFLVEAAEVEDLVEQAYLDDLRIAEEERWKWIGRGIFDGQVDLFEEEDDDEPPEVPEEEPAGFTLAQVMGMLQHYLGATVIETPPDQGHDAGSVN